MFAVLSDIHGNMFAFEKVLEDMELFDIEGVILLGDLIDYGMQSNEIVDYIRCKFKYRIICNIWGNHERAIVIEDFTGFSSERGSDCARYTASVLTDNTKDYLNTEMNKDGVQEFEMFGKRCLAVHGSLNDHYWKPIFPEDEHGDYSIFDLVFSGHSHYSHVFTKFYDVDNPTKRNKHAVTFINPGSVGQPRNHNPAAQYALIDDSLNIYLRSVTYEVDKAMELYDGKVDIFYKERLKKGI
ncbi:metallophosphoesterase family protein [Butyrivibrio fibrisolvens]|uniref:metallophosphoesterase family protein n=1 Tax=Butyrivibrio fibrisolvens TaxID=831 RepID=UPI00042951B3|nr:metallophosphoesterase family protein [Butyrivibrio fibrisolvens]